ncbi:MAG: hypothetical protein CR977_01295 [Gammaproteobacteria bacterium]|nr:MAG: hypothetical protein CR977_01295 [Gammaproteobacteria bacterium]
MFRFFSTLLAFVGALAFAQVSNLDNIGDASGFGGSEICTNTVLTNTGNTGDGSYLRLSVPSGSAFTSAELSGNSIVTNGVGVFPTVPNNTLTVPITNKPITGKPQLTLDKVITLAIDSNADGNINPGELVRIDMVLQNVGPTMADNVQLCDDLSSFNVTLVDYSVTTSQGTVISKSPLLAVNIGSIAPGATATVSFLANAESVARINYTATASDASGKNVNHSASVKRVQSIPVMDIGGLLALLLLMLGSVWRLSYRRKVK